MVRNKNWTENEWGKKKKNPKNFKNLQKAWTTIDEAHLQMTRQSGSLEANHKGMRCGSRHLAGDISILSIFSNSSVKSTSH